MAGERFQTLGFTHKSNKTGIDDIALDPRRVSMNSLGIIMENCRVAQVVQIFLWRAIAMTKKSNSNQKRVPRGEFPSFNVAEQ